MRDLPADIFKAYDIRGIVGSTLTPEIAKLIGRAVGSQARDTGQSSVVVGWDGRLSSPELASALIEGLLQTGIDVIDIGMVTTPMAYFAAHHLETGAAAMVTGSHNPPEYNGIKIVLDGDALHGEAIQALRSRIEAGDFHEGRGGLRREDVSEAYLHRIAGDVRLARPMKVLIDAGNGVAGAYAPRLFRALGCEVEELYCEVDGRFPNHHPDPSIPENLGDLQARLRTSEAEIGLAFDGDGDRLWVVVKSGEIIYPDRLLMLFAEDVLARNPGALVIYDVKSTRHLHKWIADRGGRPLIWKTGHSVIKAKMKETGALLAGEFSGHIFFKDRWYGFDDGLYVGARLLELRSQEEISTSMLDALPISFGTPELHVAVGQEDARQFLAAIRVSAHFEGALRVIDIDGLRVEFERGFGLVRVSNTTSSILYRFEAETRRDLMNIMEIVNLEIQRVRPTMVAPRFLGG